DRSSGDGRHLLSPARVLGFDPDRRVHGGTQATRDGARDRPQVHPHLCYAVLALVQIERAAHVAELAAERDAPPIAERLRHAGAGLNLLSQADVGTAAEPAGYPA